MTTENWWVDALCAEVGGDMWFPDSAGRYADLEAAKAICAACPVFAECDAAGANEDFGIWAGRSRSDRRRSAA